MSLNALSTTTPHSGQPVQLLHLAGKEEEADSSQATNIAWLFLGSPQEKNIESDTTQKMPGSKLPRSQEQSLRLLVHVSAKNLPPFYTARCSLDFWRPRFCQILASKQNEYILYADFDRKCSCLDGQSQHVLPCPIWEIQPTPSFSFNLLFGSVYWRLPL